MRAFPIAKVTYPTPIGVLPRKRLFTLLDRKRQRPVIWVSGPPGSGKTTLATSYIEARKIPCLWYQVDKADADPATFFYYLGQAMERAAPRKRKPLPLLTPEYLQGISTFSIRYFENLFARLKIPSLIVFDNYQEVPTESPFHEIILHGRLSPSKCRKVTDQRVKGLLGRGLLPVKNRVQPCRAKGIALRIPGRQQPR